MATEKRELILDLLARNKMGPGATGAAKDLDKVGDAAARGSKKAEQFGKSAILAGEGADQLGDSSRDAQKHVDKLDSEIDKINQDLVFLAASFTTASNAAERLDISKGIRKAENDLRRLSKSKSILENILPEEIPAAQVQRFTTKLASSISSSLAGAPPIAIAGTLLGAAMAPTLAAGIAGAVVGGIGIGGIIGGISRVAKDPAIADHAKRIGQNFVKNVDTEAKQAFLGPVKNSLAAVEALAARSAPKIGKIFDNTAPGVNKLTDAVVRSGDALLNSAVVASGKTGPALEAIGRIVQGTSESVGKFITMLASNSEEGASALDDLNMGLQNTITFTAAVVNGLANAKGALDDADNSIDRFRYSLEDNASWLDITADGYKKGSEAAKLYRDGVIGAAGSVNDYDHYLAGATERTNKLATAHDNATRAAKGERDALVQLSNELRAQTDPVFGLRNAQDDLAKKQKAAADATSKHGSNSREARRALRDLAESALDLQGKVGALGGTFNGKMTPALRNTLRAAGLTENQMDALEREFRNAKAAADRYAKTYRATVVTTYKTNRENFVGPVAPGSPYSKRASGGPVSRGTPYLVGENGPELMVPTAAGRIMSAAATRGVAKVGAASGNMTMMSGQGQVLRLEVVGQQEIVTFVRYLIRSANLLQG